jgi:hypothetical protein
MITNVRRVKSSGDIQRYVRYTIAPDEEQNHEDYVFGERTLARETDYIDIGLDVERNKASHEITDQIMQWNKDHRTGKKEPARPAVAGVIAFSINDTKHLYSTSRHGVRYLDRKRAIEIAREAIKETMGGDRPIYLALHGDKDHLHVHFVASIVNSKGQIWDGSTLTDEHGNKTKVRDYRQWELTNEKLEIKYGLERVTHRKAMEPEGEHRQAQVKRPSNAEVHLLKDKGVLSDSMDLAGRLEKAYNESDKQFDKFLELAEASGIRIKPNMSTTKVNGLSFAIDGMDGFIKASDLGNKYKWSKLEKELNYEHSRDFQKLAECKNRASATASTTGPDITKLREHQQQDIDGTRANQHLATIADRITTATEITDRLTADTRPTEQTENIVEQASGSIIRNARSAVVQEPGTSDQHHNNDSIELVTIQAAGPSFEPKQPGTDRTVEVSNDRNGQEAKQTECGFNEQQPVATGDSQEAEIERYERTIKTIMNNGNWNREQAEHFYKTEQAKAAKKAEEPAWTPDKPVAKEPVKSEATRQLEAMLAFQKQSNRQQQSHTYGRSDDGLSM